MEEWAQKVESIRAEAEGGNFRTAIQLLRNYPRRHFGVDYDPIYDLVAKWANALATQELNLHFVETLFKRAIAQTSGLLRLNLPNRCEKVIAEPMKSFLQFEHHARSIVKGCEFKHDAFAIIQRFNSTLAGLRQQAN